MQIGAAGAVDGARVFSGQRKDVAGPAGRLLKVDVGETLPAAAYPDKLTADFGAAVDHILDHRIESGHIAAAGENADALGCHAFSVFQIRKSYYKGWSRNEKMDGPKGPM